MKSAAFDQLSRRMGAATTRRGLLRIFAGGVAVAAASALLPRGFTPQAAGATPTATPKRPATASPTSTPKLTETPQSTETPAPRSTQTAMPQLAQTPTPRPSETATPRATETATPPPTETSNPVETPRATAGVTAEGASAALSCCTIGPFDQVCCNSGETCYPAIEDKNILGACCPQGTTFCGAPFFASACCATGQTCSQGLCCPEGQENAGGQCCPSAQACGGICCPAGQACGNGGETCCPAFQNNCGENTLVTACGNTCCTASTLDTGCIGVPACCNGACCPSYGGDDSGPAGFTDCCSGACCPASAPWCAGGKCCNTPFATVCAGQCCPGVCCGNQCCQGYCVNGQCSSTPPNSGCNCPADHPVCLSLPLSAFGPTCLTNAEFDACVSCVSVWGGCRALCQGADLGPGCSEACDQTYTNCLQLISGDIDPSVAESTCLQLP
jgi:hypothetical protein